MRMSPEIQAEYDRLKAYPLVGEYTFLHHEGPIIERTDCLMERVDYIICHKPRSEQLVRLRHIQRIPPDILAEYERVTAPAWAKYKRVTARAERDRAWAEYERVKAQAWAEYERVKAQAWAEYERVKTPAASPVLALIPDCQWDGKSIFGKHTTRPPVVQVSSDSSTSVYIRQELHIANAATPVERM